MEQRVREKKSRFLLWHVFDDYYCFEFNFLFCFFFSFYVCSFSEKKYITLGHWIDCKRERERRRAFKSSHFKEEIRTHCILKTTIIICSKWHDEQEKNEHALTAVCSCDSHSIQYTH